MSRAKREDIPCPLCRKMRHIVKAQAGKYCKSCRNRISNLTKKT